MKKLTIIGLLLAALAGGTLYVGQLQKAGQNQRRLAELEEKLQQTEMAVASEERRNKALQTQLQETDSRFAEKISEAKELQETSATTSPPKSAEPGAGAKLLSDPKMRATMKKQHLEGAERTIDQIVNAEFIQRLNLNEEQAAYLKELLRKKAGTGVEMLIALMSGQDEAKLAELGRTMKQEKEGIDAQIKAFLGEEGYKLLEGQEDSQTERARLKDLRARFASAGQPLSAEQESQLLAAMYDERRNFHFQNDYNDASKFDYEHLHEFLTEEKFNVFFGEMEQLNGRIRQRAQNILTPEQLDRFRELQQDQLEKSKMTIKMTQALFPTKRVQH